MKNLIVFICIAIVCYSCSSTSLMSLSVLESAPVSIPGNTKSVGVINRSQASNENKTVDAIHRVLSLESANLQTAGAQASVRGLTDGLIKNNKFEVKSLNGIDLRSFGAGVFPSSLPWETVEQICKENNTDLLFSLELFDTESKINYSSNSTSINTGFGNIPALEHQVNMLTSVKNGWRIYDPSTRVILDEYILSRNMSFSGKGINPLVAASGLIGREEAVKQVSINIGLAYASRIIPVWIRVSRYYFVNGDPNFKMAQRKAQSGNWDGAGQIWQQETTNPNGKLAGRACYNMAIICEINGNLDGAIQWAQKAYENYRNPLALSYVGILQNRKADNAILKSQNVAAKN